MSHHPLSKQSNAESSHPPAAIEPTVSSPHKPQFPLQAILDAASEVSIIATNPDGVIQVFNRGAEKLLGYSALEMIGVATPATFHLSDEVEARGQQLSTQFGFPISGFEVFVAVPKQAGIESREWTYVTKDGNHRTVNLSVTCVRDTDGNITGYLGVALDVTERRQAERELERLALVASRTDNAVVITDAQGYVEWVNEGFTRITGYTLEEIQGKKPGSVLQGPDTDPQTVQQIRKCIRAGSSFEGEIYNYAKDGRSYWLALSISPVFDSERHLQGFVAVQMDISDRKAAELELRRAKEAAEAANLAKSQFLANMSHEIRTPMTAILGFADILSLRLSDPQNLDCVQTIHRNGEHLLTIINDILDLSKIEAGKLEIERVSCSIRSLIDEVVNLLKVRAEGKALKFSAEIRSAVPVTIQTDPTRLRQILLNLVGNAIKFTVSGSVRLVVDCQTCPEGNRLEFSVIDTGPGIAESEQLRLFSPFTQADASMSRRHGGTGLGLAISRRLARMLGGDISIRSQPGIGSTFIATVEWIPGETRAPLDDFAKTPSDSVIAREEVSTLPLHNLRLLCAEDGIDNQRLLLFVLTKAGAQVVMVPDGQQAVAAWQTAVAQGEPWDAILLDLQMPVMDGYIACGELRKLGCKQPILALTAHASVQHEAKCREAGFDGFASKPIKAEKLIRFIADLTSGSGK